MIIHDRSKGVRFDKNRYVFNGDICAHSLDVRIELYVLGNISIDAGIRSIGGIEATKGIYVQDGGITSDGDIIAGLDIDATYYIKAAKKIISGREINTTKGIIAGDGIFAGEGIYSRYITGKVKRVFGIDVNSFLSISSYCWPVFIFDSIMAIGCEIHPIKEWFDFSDMRITRMSPYAIEFWKQNKDFLLYICKTQQNN